MKANLSAGMGVRILIGLALLLSAGPAAEAGRELDMATPPQEGTVLGDYRWSPLGGPIAPGGWALGFAVHPTLSGTLYAAVSTSGGGEIGPSTIYRSTDGAASWTAVYQAENQVTCLAAAGSLVYAGASQHNAAEVPAIYVSRDGGDTWEAQFSMGGRGVLFDASANPSHPDRAILGGEYYDESGRIGVMFGTTDGGLTWSRLLQVSVPGQAAAFTAVLISPHDPDLMLAALRGDGPDDTHIYRSTDGGASWTDAFSLADVHLSSFVAHSTDPQIFYAASSASSWPRQVYRSSNAGLTWDLVLADQGGPLAFEPPSTVYAASDWAVWASLSNGDPGTWSQVGSLPDSASRLGIDLGAAPAVLYAGLNSDAVALSTDAGAHWQVAADGIAALAAPRDVDVAPLDPDTILVSTRSEKGGWRSEDGGGTWTQVMGSGSVSFEIQPGDPDVVYAGMRSCDSATIWRSDDGGLTFDSAYTPTWFVPDCSGGEEEIVALEAAPSNPLTVYAAGTASPAGEGGHAVVVYSHDGGFTWTERSVLPPSSEFWALAVSPVDDQVAFAGGYDHRSGSSVGVIYRTLDGGGTWQPVFASHETVISIAIDYADPDVLYAGGGATWWAAKSTDGGDTWQQISWEAGYVAIDPNDHNRIYVGGWGCILESPDGGATWSGWDAPLNQGTPMAGPGALAVDTGTPVQALYAGWNGLWSYTRLAPAAGDRYVATGGDDEWNNCTDPAAPCQTVAHALGLANPAETVRIAAGTYVENLAVDRSVSVEGGYSGPPEWTRDLGAYETVLDGSANPAVPGVWDGEGVGLPGVLWDTDAGMYRMYYTGLDPWSNSIGLATSPDGVVWTRYAGNPVVVGDGQTWEGIMVEEPFVRMEGNGNYKMWYGNGASIGYATSPDGVTWTKYPTPVFEPNSNPLAWDSAQVRAASIVRPGAQYLMAYTGTDGSGVWQIGIATSSDGITWARHGEPVLGPGAPGAWDEGGAYRSDLAYAGGLYHLLYTGLPNRQMGVATSSDGYTWTEYAGNPVLPGGDPWESQRTWGAGHFSMGGQWMAWYAAQADAPLAIGLATSADGLAWTPDSGHNPVFLPGTPGDVQGAPVVRIYTPEVGAFGGATGRMARLENLAAAQPRPDLVDVTLDGLTLTGGTYWSGGALTVESGRVTLRSVHIADNQAFYDGGGIWVAGGSTVHLVTSEIADNSALGGGGGLYSAGTADLSRSTLSGNQAGWGGGILNDAGSLDVANCTLTGNSAGSAGGIAQKSGSLDLVSSTLSGNSAPRIGGVQIAGGTARAWDALLAADGGGECEGPWSDGSNNLATDDTCGSPFNQVTLEQLRLGDLSGSPAYYPLLPWSVAIDAGTTDFCIEVDEPGNVRPQDGDGDGVAVCDVGAYEAATIVVRYVYLPVALRNAP